VQLPPEEARSAPRIESVAPREELEEVLCEMLLAAIQEPEALE